MKRIIFFFLTAILCFSTVDTNAQLKGLGKRIKQKVNERIDRRFDQAVDKALDETEEEIVDVATGEEQQTGQAPNESAGAPPAGATTNPSSGSAGGTVAASTTGAGTFAVNTKFDFVPGAQLMVFEDFEQDAVGDFPAR